MLARGVILTLAMTVVLAGCAVNRYVVTPYDDLTFFASPDLNPDDDGRASPIAVKVYQLTARTTFDNLDFDAAFSNADVVLSDELIVQSDLVLQPGGRQSLEIELDAETRFVAVTAAYRHIDRARWKLVLPVNGDWYYSHEITLTANGLRLGPPNSGHPVPARRAHSPSRDDHSALRTAEIQ